MKLRLKTDYALRVLLYLTHHGNLRGGSNAGQPVTALAMSEAFDISKDHVVKCVQELARRGWVSTQAGRKGGVTLAADPRDIDLADVVAAFEGPPGVLECVPSPSVCVLEPGCLLRGRLIEAERAFYASLAGTSIADLCKTRGRKGGLLNLDLN